VSAECFAGLVKADDRTVLIIWFVIEVKHVLHVVGELAFVFSWNCPVVVEMRFQGVF
jgi:hypothetical protein